MPEKNLPGKLGLPWIGETLSFAAHNHRFFETRARKYGPVFKTRLFGQTVVCFSGAEAYSFFSEQPHFERAGANPPHIEKLLAGQSLPLLDAERHQTVKRLVLEAFTPAQLDTYLPLIEKTFDDFAPRWERQGQFAWIPELQQLAASLCAQLFLGDDLPALRGTDLSRVITTFVAGFAAMPVPLPFTTFGKAMKARDRLLALIDAAIDEHHSREYQDLLSHLMKVRLPGGELLEREQLRLEMLHLVFAGFGGIYIALTHLVLALAQFPRVRERARREVDENAAAGALTCERLDRLSFLDRMSKEIRRYNRINSSTFFVRVKDDFEYQGYRIPRGWRAIGAIYVTLQDLTVFDQPERFRPDRFAAGESGRCPHAAAYVPHGGGPRTGHRCPGEDLITVLIKAVAVRLLREYSWSVPLQDLSLTKDLFPVPKSNLLVDFERQTE